MHSLETVRFAPATGLPPLVTWTKRPRLGPSRVQVPVVTVVSAETVTVVVAVIVEAFVVVMVCVTVVTAEPVKQHPVGPTPRVVETMVWVIVTVVVLPGKTVKKPTEPMIKAATTMAIASLV